ncbi:renal glandular kallikrein-like isoform X2 [Mastomys coucha]|uniref:renal glandular kallikrein-like isoform X2 n=1 Tax=Mastomys coucha TaxID=35658 RepID=UPI0012623753|nr:renal glandular kallikrein-like isoform X2 [Mastomys coucha]
MWFLILFLALSLAGIDAVPPVQNLIVGGFNCEKNSQPWNVIIFSFTEDKIYQCSGVLLDLNWVLTAAHCYNDNYQVWLGKNNQLEEEPSAQQQFVSKSFPHPGFNMSLMKVDHRPHRDDDYSNDLMLLRLSEPAEITDVVKPLDLPTEEPTVGSRCLASGWGSITPTEECESDDLQCVYLKLMPNQICAKVYLEKVTDAMLCAGEMDGSKDTCGGDSGGPLICDGVLQGITSFGPSPCATPNVPSIYTKLIIYKSWIKDIMANNP